MYICVSKGMHPVTAGATGLILQCPLPDHFMSRWVHLILHQPNMIGKGIDKQELSKGIQTHLSTQEPIPLPLVFFLCRITLILVPSPITNQQRRS